MLHSANVEQWNLLWHCWCIPSRRMFRSRNAKRTSILAILLPFEWAFSDVERITFVFASNAIVSNVSDAIVVNHMIFVFSEWLKGWSAHPAHSRHDRWFVRAKGHRQIFPVDAIIIESTSDHQSKHQIEIDANSERAHPNTNTRTWFGYCEIPSLNSGFKCPSDESAERVCTFRMRQNDKLIINGITRRDRSMGNEHNQSASC